MAKSKQVKIADEVQEDSRRSDAGDAPFAGDVQSPDELRKPTVESEPAKSFDERTGVQQPWLKSNGEQDNGTKEESEGARASATREDEQ